VNDADNHGDALIEDNVDVADDNTAGAGDESPSEFEDTDPIVAALKKAGHGDLVEDYTSATLRRKDYTQKTTSLSEARKELAAERAALAERERVLLAALEQRNSETPRRPEANVEVEEEPDRKSDPNGWFQYHLRKQVTEGIKPMLDAILEERLAPLQKDLEPVRQTNRLEAAIASFQDGNPEWRGVDKVRELGKIVASNPRLQKLVDSDPETALGLAAEFASIQSKSARSQKTSRGRASAAPTAARRVTTAPVVKEETLMDAFNNSIRELGGDPAAFAEA